MKVISVLAMYQVSIKFSCEIRQKLCYSHLITEAKESLVQSSLEVKSTEITSKIFKLNKS
jgi:hypothetical protein